MCNLYKGSNLTGIDPITHTVCRLFNPRIDVWEHHFAFGMSIEAKTDIGRTTIRVLNINEPLRVKLRIEINKNKKTVH
jgi:hypothetical protein